MLFPVFSISSVTFATFSRYYELQVPEIQIDPMLLFCLFKCQKLYGWNNTSLRWSSFAIWLSSHGFAFLVSMPSHVFFSLQLLWLFVCLPFNQISDTINNAAGLAGFIHHPKLLSSSNSPSKSHTCQNSVCINIYHIWIK